MKVFELLKNYPNESVKYNPIVIEGNFGVGKTHLLNAFKNEHSDKYNIKIVNCFDFAYDLTNVLIFYVLIIFYLYLIEKELKNTFYKLLINILEIINK